MPTTSADRGPAGRPRARVPGRLSAGRRPRRMGSARPRAPAARRWHRGTPRRRRGQGARSRARRRRPRTAAGAGPSAARMRIASAVSSVVRIERPSQAGGHPGRAVLGRGRARPGRSHAPPRRSARPAAGPARRAACRPAPDPAHPRRSPPTRAGRRPARVERARGRSAIASRPSRTSNGDRGRVLVDGHPVGAAAKLEPRPAQHERPVGVVLELVLGVDAALDRDIARAGRRRARGLGDADRGRRREEPPDAVARPEAAQHHRAGAERDDTQRR